MSHASYTSHPLATSSSRSSSPSPSCCPTENSQREAPLLEPSGAAGWVAVVLHGKPEVKARHSVRMSRRIARLAGLCASESPLTRRTDECRHEGRDPENTTPPITMRSDHLALRNSALKNRGVNATPSTMIFPASSTSCHEPKVTAPLIVTLPL